MLDLPCLVIARQGILIASHKARLWTSDIQLLRCFLFSSFIIEQKELKCINRMNLHSRDSGKIALPNRIEELNVARGTSHKNSER
jgi:hypothetical protein